MQAKRNPIKRNKPPRQSARPDQLAFTVRQASELIGWNPKTIYSHIADGNLKVVRPNKAILIPRGELLKFLGITEGDFLIAVKERQEETREGT